MSDFVTLRHPKLPDKQTIRVHRKRIGARLAAGWVEAKPVPEPAAPAVEEAKPTESASKRRSRTNSEEQ